MHGPNSNNNRLRQLPSAPAPTWLYELTEAVGRPLPRSFPPPRKVKAEWPPPGGPRPSVRWRLGICPPPAVGRDRALAFVVAKMTWAAVSERHLWKHSICVLCVRLALCYLVL